VKHEFTLILEVHAFDIERAIALVKKIRGARLRNAYKSPADVWGEDPNFPLEDWSREAKNHDTWLGYWEWVDSSRELYAQDELEQE